MQGSFAKHAKGLERLKTSRKKWSRALALGNQRLSHCGIVLTCWQQPILLNTIYMKRILLCFCLSFFVMALAVEAAQSPWTPPLQPQKPHAQTVKKKKKMPLRKHVKHPHPIKKRT